MTPEREQAVGARLREKRQAAGLTLVEAEAKSGVSKSTISEIELTPAGAELAPSADDYCKWHGYELVRGYSYELRDLPPEERRERTVRASRTHASKSSKISPKGRGRLRPKLSSRSATASRAASKSSAGKRRTTSSKRRARRGGR